MTGNEKTLRALPISEYQKRFLLEWSIAPDELVYNISYVNKITGAIDEKLLKKACAYFVQNNEVVHLRYSSDDDFCYDGGFTIDDFYSEIVVDNHEPIESQIRRLIDEPFDLNNDLLLRIYLLKDISKGKGEYYFFFVAHHIICDMVWIMQFFKQIENAYDNLLKGNKLKFREEETFTKAVKAEQMFFKGFNHEKAKDFWLEFIGDLPPKLNLPYSSEVDISEIDNVIADKAGGFIYFDLSKSQSKEVYAYALKEKVSVFVLLSSLFGLVLSKYCGQSDFLLTYPVNMRPKIFRNVTGSFINNLPLKFELNKSKTFSDLLKQTATQRKEVLRFQHYSFTNIIRDQRKKLGGQANTFFNVGFAESYLHTIPFNLKDSEVIPLDISWCTDSMNEIGMLYDKNSSEVLKFKLEYRKALFEPILMDQIVNAFKHAITDLLKTGIGKISEYSILPPKEYKKIVYDWNVTDADFPSNTTIHGLFEEIAKKKPDDTALIFEDKKLTFKELDEKSNQLANHLRTKHKEINGVPLRTEAPIALFLDRGFEMVISILSVLKVGGAYVPIAPDYPKNRLDYILKDTNASFILSKKALVSTKPHFFRNSDKLVLVDLDQEFFKTEEITNIRFAIPSNALAYIIYTSGTTGKPKGVMIEHLSVVNLVTSLMELYQIGHDERFMLFANYVFDGSVEQIFLPLLSGSILYIVNESILDSQNLTEFIKETGITHFDSTPTHLSSIPPSKLDSLKRIVFGAEKVPFRLFAKYQKSISKVYNAYGATETTVTSFVSLNTNYLRQKTIQNTKTYVLDNHGIPVPIGVIGELYISGVGLSRGYLNNPDLTEEQFIKNSYLPKTKDNEFYNRLYKTGDLVRWTQDGCIEYLGRNDNQVKIRGYRIELAEIENVLNDIAGVSQSCILIKERMSKMGMVKFLVGYYLIDKTEKNLDSEEILKELSNILPHYMIPKFLIKLEKFPLTITRKLDKKALLDIDLEKAIVKEYFAPKTKTEIFVSKVWQDVLGINDISIKDNFFSIGGDSILSIQVSSRIRQKGYNCQVKDIFNSKTIENLSILIEGRKTDHSIKTEQGLLKGKFDLLPIQKWFFNQVDSGKFNKPNHWNQSFMIKVPSLNTNRLKNILNIIVEYHDIFRASYFKNGDLWYQKYENKKPIYLFKTLDVRSLNEEQKQNLLTKWQSNFSLDDGILFCFGYLKGYKDNSARIFVAAHHLIIDSVSWKIILGDIKTLYYGRNLPEKGSSYRQWVNLINSYSKTYPEESLFWKNQLLNNIEGSFSINEVKESNEVSVYLSKKATKSLLYEASKTYNTHINDLLLTALIYALYEVNKSVSQRITIEGHGREDIDSSIDHSRTVGWFTTMFPVKLDLKGTIHETIKSVKEILKKIPNKGVGFGGFVNDDNFSFGYDSLPAICFNYLGQLDSEKTENWQISAEGSGINVNTRNEDSFSIEVNCFVSESRMNFNVKSKLDKQKTEILGNSIKINLKKIIDHCLVESKKIGIHFTPSDFGLVNISDHLLTKLQQQSLDKGNKIENILPANSLQKGFIYHALNRKEDDAYRLQVLYDYKHPFDVEKYLEAWNICIRKYPILRTAFNWEEELVQVIYKEGQLKSKYYDLSNLARPELQRNKIEGLRLKDKNQGFDLKSPTLLRLYIFKQSDNHYTVLRSEHHSISDGWSSPILLRDVHNYYKNLLENKVNKYVVDTTYIKSQEFIHFNRSNLKPYWDGEIASFQGASSIDSLLSSKLNSTKDYEVQAPDSECVKFEGDYLEKIKTFIVREGITLNVLIQFSWHKLLQVYSSVFDTVVGTTISGRDLPIVGIDNSVGLYINTLPLIINWDNENTIQNQLHLVQNKLIDLNNNGYYDLAKLNVNGRQLFNTLLVFENYPDNQDINTNSLGLNIKYIEEKVNYPLCLIIHDSKNYLEIKLQYDRKVLTKEKAEAHLSTLYRIIDQVICDSMLLHNSIDILSPEVYNRLVTTWNSTEKTYPSNRSVQELFEEQVEKTPNAIALVFGERNKLSFAELNEKSNQLANYLRNEYFDREKRSLKPDTPIIIFLDKGFEMIIGILAILKAGGAYVPVDLHYPQDRVDFIIKDTQSPFILTKKRHTSNSNILLPSDKVVLIDLDEPIYQSTDTLNLMPQNKSNDLAYIIYTSGTTGKPKGVMIEHRSITSLVYNDYISISSSSDDVFAFLSSPVFDAATFEIWTPLLTGNTLAIPNNVDGVISSVHEFRSFLEEMNVSILWLTKTLFENLFYIDTKLFGNLKYLIVGGEALDKDSINQLVSSKHKPRYLLNGYGPTESTTFTCVFPIEANIDGNSVPIGKPINNRKVYVLDSYLKPVPVGVVGELHIAGVGLARGYLNETELTEQSFITNPFVSDDGHSNSNERLYKSGDLVRWLENGNLEFLGRSDNQIKIRGYRIEIGEIEHAISSIPGVQNSLVIIHEKKIDSGNSKFLLGYYIKDRSSSKSLSNKSIIDSLADNLPEYMIPTKLIELDSFPTTINGKIDKDALPIPKLESDEEVYVRPTTKNESIICQIWEELLALDRVGLTDNFFKIGGDSISAIQLSHRLGAALKLEIKVADIFKYKTPSNLLTNCSSHKEIIIEKLSLNPSPLSFAQERLWFIEKFEEGTDVYHMPSVYELSSKIEIEGVKYALEQIVKRHEVLRSTINQEDGEIGTQRVHDYPVTFPQTNLVDSQDILDIIKKDISRPFDLTTEYPVRFKFYFLDSLESQKENQIQRILLLINFHHIASDGWSTEIFEKELLTFYEAFLKDQKESALPSLEIQYNDYAVWQRNFLSTEVIDEQLTYWKNKLRDFSNLNFPTDRPRPDRIDYRGNQRSFTISFDTSNKIREIAKRNGITSHSVLLSATYVLLSKYSGQEDVVIGSPIANRHYKQTKDLIGFFVNMQVNRINLGDSRNFNELIKKVHEDQVMAQLYQDVPFERIVDELGVSRDSSRHPIFQFAFVVQSFGTNKKVSEKFEKYFKPFQGFSTYDAENFDLTIYVDDSGREISGLVSYATSLFEQTTIDRFIDCYIHLINQLVTFPNRNYRKMVLLPTYDYEKIIYGWNNTESYGFETTTITENFLKQVERTPDKVALTFEDQNLTYKELNQKSNQLARHIQKELFKRTKQRIKSDTLIALYVDRSMEMIVGILAVLKAGGAYVPIDPSHPIERCSYIISHTESQFILCKKSTSHNIISEFPKSKLMLIDFAEDFYENEQKANLPNYNKPTDLAYVIYTSGTTGQPKGVMVEHNHVLAFTQKNNFIDYNKAEIIAGISNYAFDGSIFDIFFTLNNGKKLVLVKQEYLQDLGKLNKYFIEQNVDSVFVTTAFFNLLIINKLSCLKKLKQILFGGESCNRGLVNDLKRRYKNLSVIHVYGPTENIVYSSFCSLNDYNTEQVVPIGSRLSDKKLYVLDKERLPVPIGVIGELYIGGVGVSRGYINDSDSTNKRFIPNPYATQEDIDCGSNLFYMTGDLVRWLPDGNLEFIGRNDNQIKIRGYRIELAEVENALLKVPGIKQACVIAKEHVVDLETNKFLVGYYVLDESHDSGNTIEVLDSWERLYNSSVYDKKIDQLNIHSDFSGWNSYITGRPIPLKEMKVWRAEVMDKLWKLNPKNVLEIGVGSGLLMYPLLESVQSYTGLDISKPVIERHNNYLKSKKKNVRLYHLRANQIDEIPDEIYYDTVIINSVCQYFPSIEYFQVVLDKVISKLGIGGSIFYGDIRNYDLHEELIREKLVFDKIDYDKNRIEQIAQKENELLISPEYFKQLKHKYSNIQIDFQARNGKYTHELSKYRFDVIIRASESNRILKKNDSNKAKTFEITDEYRYHNIPFLNQLNKEDIKKHLSKFLPDYMIPLSLIAMNSLPLSSNGKIDKKLLPDSDFIFSKKYVEPRSELEIALCNIWRKVLGVDLVGIHDDFFSLGGNSILAIRVSHLMSIEINSEIVVADIFRYKCISQILSKLQNKENLNIPKSHINPAPLSFAQERIWFFEQFDKGTSAYHMPAVYDLADKTSKEGIIYALQKVIARHEILRTTIGFDKSERGIQTVNINSLPIEEQEITDETDIESLIKNDVERAFDLETEYPIRVKFYIIQSKQPKKKEPKRNVLLINIHHIASDGWSMEIFDKELMSYYLAFERNDKKFELPKLDIQYKDYSIWQRKFLTKEIIETQLNYWKTRLFDYQTLDFPTDFPRPKFTDYKGDYKTFKLNKRTSKDLRLLAKRCGVTLNTVLLSATNILFGKYTGQKDIILGSPVANRHYRQTENLIGFFVNTQINRTKLKEFQTFEELIQQVHLEQIGAQLHQDLPFERLVLELEVERDLSRNPIFQIWFGVQSFGSERDCEKSKYLKPFKGKLTYDLEQFDMSIYLNESHEEITGEISYSTRLFKENTISRLIENYIYLLSKLAKQPTSVYNKLCLLPPNKYNKIIYEWNKTGKNFPREQTIHRIFETQVSKQPNRKAVIFKDNFLSYSELNTKSNQLAHFIKANYIRKTGKEISPDSLVAICLERGLEMIVGILAILKAGGAYVPIDPDYPKSRRDYILSDTKAKLVLSQRKLSEKFNSTTYKEKVIYIDLDESIYNLDKSNNLLGCSSSQNLVYVLYTSGTTGNPKGVMVEHKGLVNLLNFHNENYTKNCRNLNIALLSNYVFDFSVYQIFNAILYGHTLHILPKNVILDTLKFQEYLKDYKINAFEITPTLFSYLALSIEDYSDYNLKLINIGGEKLGSDLVSKFYTKNGSSQISIINSYGPTEYTIDATTYKFDSKNSNTYNTNTVSIPIGRPIDNTRVYILDNNLIPVPVGVKGELYIGGVGLSRGYLNKKSLMKDLFVNNPFRSNDTIEDDYKLLYKTGDFVRWDDTGNIEYIGRNDNQIKIRGQRIELSEIEYVLSKIPQIEKCCVLFKKNESSKSTEGYIVAYYTTNTGEKRIDESELKTDLLKSLPDYMIPDIVMPIKRFPVNSNGKIDEQLLPTPKRKFSEDDFIPPSTKFEKAIAKIWMKELQLDVNQISVNRSFFELGGHSLNATAVLNQINTELKTNVSLADVFTLKTIKSIALLAKNSRSHQSGGHEVELIIPLNIVSSATANIFWIHEISGDVQGYLQMTHLMDNYNSYGIRSLTLESVQPKNITAHSIAIKYISSIKKIQPIGPYNIGGWSLGGLLAFEVAKQLERQGEQVNSLIMIDTDFYEFSKRQAEFDLRNEFLVVDELLENIMLEVPDKKNTTKGFWNEIINALDKDKNQLSKISTSVPHALKGLIPNIQNLNAYDFIRALNTVRSLDEIDFQLDEEVKLKAKLIFIKAKDTMLKATSISKYFERDIYYKEIEGNHYTIMQNPRNKLLVENIMKAFNGKMDEE